MEYLSKAWNFIKKPVVYSSILAASSIAAIYFYTKALPPRVKLSSFLSELHSGKIREIVDFGDSLTFKSSKGS